MLSPRTALINATPVDDEGDVPEVNEIASIAGGRDITRPYIDPLGQLILPQDEVLLLKGELGWRRLELYEKVRQDDQVFSCMQQRISAVKQAEWDVLPGERKGRSTTKADERAADFIRDQLNNGFGAKGSWDSCTEKMHWGILYGYSVAEVLYGRDGRYVSVDADRGGIRVRNRKRFQFDVTGTPRLLTPTGPWGEVLPPRKFWHFATGADNDDEPYGLGLGHWLYWPTWFKRNDLKFWLFFLEKFGQPTAMGKYQSGVHGSAEQAKLLSALNAILTDAGIIIPEGMNIELLEASRSGTADYEAVYDHMNSAISKVILSQTMTTDDGSSLSQATVHERVGDAVKKSDADLLNGSFNGSVVRWLIDYNRSVLGDCTYPQVWRRVEPEEDINNRAEREAKLFQVGYRLSPEEFESVYGEGYEPVMGMPLAGTSPQPSPSEGEGADAEVSPLISPMPSGQASPTQGEGGAAPVEDVQGTALNGAQIKSLLELVQAVVAGELPFDSAVQLVLISFPMVDEARARALLSPSQGFEMPSSPQSETSPQPSPSEGEGAEPSEPAEPEFAAVTPTADLYAVRLRGQGLFTPMIGRIREEYERVIAQGGSLEEFRGYLDRAFPDLPTEELEGQLTQALTASRFAGIAEAEAEAEDAL